MKHILFLLLLFHTNKKTEIVTATAAATTLLTTTAMGSAIASSIGHAFGVVTTFIAGWVIDKKIRKSHKKELKQKPTPVTAQNKTKQNDQLKKDAPCCDDCAKKSTTECFAKKKKTSKKSQSSQVTTQEKSATQNQSPENDPCPPLKERREKVKKWAKEKGFKYIPNLPFYSHSEDVYKKGNRYVTTDRDCHGGGIMKMFEGTKSSIKRVATYNKYFKIFKV